MALWGAWSYPHLERMVEEGRFEAAVAARELLDELKSTLFIGAQVELEIGTEQVAWNEPFDLTLVVHNPTPAPLRVPWPKPMPVTSTQPANEDARQVAAMLDIADFLTVAFTPPEIATIKRETKQHESSEDEENLVELRVDPIERDDDVYAQVRLRTQIPAPSHTIPPGETARLTVPAFNRGWSRCPMLEMGAYEIRFAYQPEWNDESWVESGFGRIETEPVRIGVTEPAPKAIRKGNRPMYMQIEDTGKVLELRLVSLWDRDQWVNLNIGGAIETHAQLLWRICPENAEECDAIPFEHDKTPAQFDAARLRRLAPGEMLTISRLPYAAIREHAKSRNFNAGPLQASARYVQLHTADAIETHLADRIPGDRAPEAGIPTHLYSGAAESVSVDIHP
jgi:hypothetical protein